MPPPNPLPCGCEIGVTYYTLSIAYCPLHAAAPAMLAALEKVVGEDDRKTGHDVLVHQTIIDAARAAILKAKGE